jgi:hypothetical protein
MPETLLSASAIKLFGRLVTGVTLDPAAATSGLGAGAFLRAQLAAPEVGLAMIYGYSHQGQYQILARPVLFLVHGTGTDAAKATGVETTGTAAKSYDFASDIRCWEYDRGDFSLRLDIDSGPLERILIEAEQQDGEMPYFRGAHTRFRGAHTRLRGSGE